MLVLLGAHHILHISTVRVKQVQETWLASLNSGIFVNHTWKIIFTKLGCLSRYSDWATEWKTRSSNSGRNKKPFSPTNAPHQLWDPPILLFIGYGGSYPEIKRPEHIIDYAPPSITEVKNEWRQTSASPLRLHGLDRDNFTLLHFAVYTTKKSTRMNKRLILFRDSEVRHPLRCAIPVLCLKIRWVKISPKHNYEYMAKWWCLLAIEQLHVSAYSGHIQVLTTFLL